MHTTTQKMCLFNPSLFLEVFHIGPGAQKKTFGTGMAL